MFIRSKIYVDETPLLLRKKQWFTRMRLYHIFLFCIWGWYDTHPLYNDFHAVWISHHWPLSFRSISGL